MGIKARLQTKWRRIVPYWAVWGEKSPSQGRLQRLMGRVDERGAGMAMLTIRINFRISRVGRKQINLAEARLKSIGENYPTGIELTL